MYLLQNIYKDNECIQHFFIKYLEPRVFTSVFEICNFLGENQFFKNKIRVKCQLSMVASWQLYIQKVQVFAYLSDCTNNHIRVRII